MSILMGTTLAMDPSALASMALALEAGEASLTPFVPADVLAPVLPIKAVDGVAVIPIHGVISDTFTPKNWLMGGVRTSTLIAQVLAADANPDVRLIQFDMNSPGGSVERLFELVEVVKATSTPTRSKVVGLCASACYLVASATDEIVASPLAEIGSIGAINTYSTKLPENVGVIVSEQTPLKFGSGEAALAAKQLSTNDAADVFITAVAENRGTTRADVLENYGRGAMMSASRALQAGLIDQITGVTPAMEEQLKALQAQVQTLEQSETQLKAQVVELSAKAEEAEELTTKLEAAERERLEMAQQLTDAQAKVEESNAALAAAQKAQLDAEAEAKAVERKMAIEGAAPAGRALTAELREELEMAYDLQQETGKPIFDRTVKRLAASGAGVNLSEEGHGKEVELSEDTDETTEKAKALAAEKGITFFEAQQRILKGE